MPTSGDRFLAWGWGTAFSRPTLPFAILACLLAGCTQPSGESPSGEKQVLRLVTWKPNQPEVWEQVFARFAEAHPEIELRREVGPHSSTAFHDLLTQKLKNQSRDVDVFLMDVIWPPEFGSAGWALPLEDRLPQREQDKFLPGTILANTYNGHLYGVPLYVGSGVLYYRKDLLDAYGLAPPQTWEEMVSAAQTVVAGERAEGRDLHGFSGQFKQYEGLVCNMLEYILSNGGVVLDPQRGEPLLAREPAVEAVRFVRDHIVGQSAPRGVLTYQEPESLDLFVQGKAVFHRNWPYAWEVSNNPEKSSVAGAVAIATLPHFPGQRSYATLGGWQVGVSAYSRNPDAAWTLVEFLTSEPIQRLLAIEAGLAPTRRALYQDPAVLAANPQFVPLEKVFLSAHPRPRTPLYPAVSNILQRYFSSAISDPNSDIARQAEAATSEIRTLLAMAE